MFGQVLFIHKTSLYPETWSRPIFDLHMFHFLIPLFFTNLSLLFRTIHFAHPLKEKSEVCCLIHWEFRGGLWRLQTPPPLPFVRKLLLKKVNMAVVTPTDRTKSVRNCCLIELFCGVVCVVTLPFLHFCWCRGFCHRTGSDLLLFVFLRLQHPLPGGMVDKYKKGFY